MLVEPAAATVRPAGGAGRLGADLRLVHDGCGSWTLTRTDDGTWSLSSGGTTRAVRLLLP